jgi:fluoride exporter
MGLAETAAALLIAPTSCEKCEGGAAVRVFWVGVAGAAGAISRYAIGRAIGAQLFPWATLGINLSGSFIVAFVVTYATERHWSLDVSTAITVGFVGAYTTFSTFMWESFVLGRTERAGRAVLYVAASIVFGLVAACGGYGLARSLA